jgi:fluoroacetyl-CoA thioesterase
MMNPLAKIRAGMTGTESVIVTRELTAAHFRAGKPEVFSTPMMIALMEAAAGNAIDAHLPQGWVSVGAQVHISHLAATPVGRRVTATAAVTAVTEKTASFTVEAHDGVRKIGEGTHMRGVVDLARFEQRLQAG